jgi:hypothetical protein
MSGVILALELTEFPEKITGEIQAGNLVVGRVTSAT